VIGKAETLLLETKNLAGATTLETAFSWRGRSTTRTRSTAISRPARDRRLHWPPRERADCTAISRANRKPAFTAGFR